MTPEKYDSTPAIERLRAIVRRWDGNTEAMNLRLNMRELLDLDRMWMLSGWDFYPDKWTERQVREALRGRVPTWDDNERPSYDEPDHFQELPGREGGFPGNEEDA